MTTSNSDPLFDPRSKRQVLATIAGELAGIGEALGRLAAAGEALAAMVRDSQRPRRQRRKIESGQVSCEAKGDQHGNLG
jgi:hypothetical protein